MSRSTARAASDVAVIQTDDGHAIVGGRPGTGEMYRNTTTWGAPLPDESYRKSGTGARSPQPVPGPAGPEELPNAHVARQLAGREVQRLRARADGIERDLARGVIGATGQPLPYLVQAHAEARAELPRIREEIARFESMTDLEVRRWAFERGAQ